MSKAATSVLAFGVYLVGTAALLIASPNTLLGVMGIAPATEPWIHVLGVVVLALAAYYITAARAESVAFFRASVWIRVMVLAGFGALVLTSIAPPMLVGFGVVDALGALWTWSALRT